MKRQQKLNSQQQAEEQQQAAAQHKTQETSAREFGSVEEMLRHDALHTPVPPNVATRLRKSIGSASASPAWWRRFFGGGQP